MGATFEKIVKIGSKKSFRRWWVKGTEKNARTFRSFAKEWENVPFFFLDIYRNIYRYI